MNKTSFGHKGKNKFGATYAQMLLSGAPVGRRQSARHKLEPKFKPRRKRAFGKKAEVVRIDLTAASMTETLKVHSWKKRAMWGIGIAVLFQLAAVLLIIPLPPL